MTVLAFDGTCLVADGMVSYSDERYKNLTTYSNVKIIPLVKPIVDHEKSEVLALTGAGSTRDIAMITQEIMNLNNEGIHFGVMQTRLKELLGNKTSCIIVAVGVDRSKETPTGFCNHFYTSNDYGETSFVRKENKIKVKAGWVDLPDWDIGKGWDTALEAASLACAMSPHNCGGLLTRYNVLTGVMDHPKMTDKDRVHEMLTQFERERISAIKKEMATARKFASNPTNVF